MAIELLAPVLAGGIRSIAGWLENSAKDGKFDSFEWKELFTTIVRVGVIGACIMFGLQAADVENSAMIGSVAAILVDFGYVALKKKPVTKK